MGFFISLLSIITLLSSPVKWPCIKQSPLLSGYSHHLDFQLVLNIIVNLLNCWLGWSTRAQFLMVTTTAAGTEQSL